MSENENSARPRSDFSYTKNSARPRSDYIYTKIAARPEADFIYTKIAVRPGSEFIYTKMSAWPGSNFLYTKNYHKINHENPWDIQNFSALRAPLCKGIQRKYLRKMTDNKWYFMIT